MQLRWLTIVLMAFGLLTACAQPEPTATPTSTAPSPTPTATATPTPTPTATATPTPTPTATATPTPTPTATATPTPTPAATATPTPTPKASGAMTRYNDELADGVASLISAIEALQGLNVLAELVAPLLDSPAVGDQDILIEILAPLGQEASIGHRAATDAVSSLALIAPPSCVSDLHDRLLAMARELEDYFASATALFNAAERGDLSGLIDAMKTSVLDARALEAARLGLLDAAGALPLDC